ncbi:hypothetical protein RFI_35589, partial [Reticulomyxa filosa]
TMTQENANASDNVNSEGSISCWKKELFLDFTAFEVFTCLLCKQVARNPLVLECSQHKSIGKVLIVGENCLKKFFQDNNYCCPVQPHSNFQYDKNMTVQNCIEDLRIRCPRQVEQDSQVIKQEENVDET